MSVKLREIEEREVGVTNIKLGPIERESVNSLISDTLCLPPRLCLPLSAIVHGKTGGIVLFVVQFLKSLSEEGLLWFSLDSRRWEFDISRVRSKHISQDVVQFVDQKMKKLPGEVQNEES